MYIIVQKSVSDVIFWVEVTFKSAISVASLIEPITVDPYGSNSI